MRNLPAVLLILLFLPIASSASAAAQTPVKGCMEKMNRIKFVSRRGLNPEDPVLNELVAEGTRNNACLLAALKDGTLIRNPFESPIISQVARSQLALYLVTRVNGLQMESCFPDSLVVAMNKDMYAYHAWFSRSENLSALHQRCSALVKRGVHVPSPARQLGKPI